MRKVIEWNHKWAFTKDTDEIPDVMPNRWYWVHLPHTWNAIDGQDGGNDYYRGRGYYAKEFDLADFGLTETDFPAKELYLEIPAANSCAEVYCNGVKAGGHQGGYSLWRVRLDCLKPEHNLVVIVCDNSDREEVHPLTADFTFYGGLYRGVRLILADACHFDLDHFGSRALKITPTVEGEEASVRTETWVSGLSDQDSDILLSLELLDQEGKRLAERTMPASRENRWTVKVEKAHLWNGRKDPYLYSIRARLLKNQQILDEVSSRFGFRNFELDPERGFFLNGKSYPLHGVCRHQDVWGKGNALTRADQERDLDLICEMGANTIRLAHYQHDESFYDLCDERGLIVWAEIPYISIHKAAGKENTVSQLKELILQNYNHPSIVVWGLSNEITMMTTPDQMEDVLRNHQRLNDLAHALDPTRKTVLAAFSGCSMEEPYLQVPDAVSYNLYFGWYDDGIEKNGHFLDTFHEKYPALPLGLSEYGCEALNWHGSELVRGDYTEEYQAYYHEQMILLLFSRPYLWATHVWNMFDFGCDARDEGGEAGQNHKGLVTMDRRYKKDAFYAYKAWLSDEPFVHLCGKRFVDRPEDKTVVTVYSNLPEVTLYGNHQKIAALRAEDHFFRFEVDNTGETELLAAAGDCRDQSWIRKVEKVNPSYRFTQSGPVLNWFDITTPAGKYSVQDKVKDLMKSEEAFQVIRPLWEKIEKRFDGKVNPFFLTLPLSGLIGREKLLQNMEDKAEVLEMNRMLNQIDFAE